MNPYRSSSSGTSPSQIKSSLEDRPHKRLRQHRGESENHGFNNLLHMPTPPALTQNNGTDQNDSGHLLPKPRSRGFLACDMCRSKKTKCDGQKPRCGACSKSGTTCTYIENDIASPLSQQTGTQILQSLEEVKDLLKQQNPSYDTSLNDNLSGGGQITHHHHHHYHSAYENHPQPDPGLNTGLIAGSPTLTSSAGLDSVLKWDIFPKPTPFSILPSLEESNSLPSHALPSADLVELLRLEAKFIKNVHMKNPIINLKTLRHLLLSCAENGLDWSSETCLVALICALGAISKQYKPQRIFDEIIMTESAPADDETKLAWQYWAVAAKRLGFVVAKNNLESVQCLCFAGIWHMYNMKPLQAWKYFNLASSAWYIATIIHKNSADPIIEGDVQQNLTLEQSLYFSCYKSESELVFELGLPGSILSKIDYPYTFPYPPNVDEQLPHDGIRASEQRCWYFYLADIASRHLMNRMVDAQSKFEGDPSLLQITRMLDELEIFESQLQEWYSSLPAEISFEIPWGQVVPLPDELNQYLRARYFSIRELVYRPFVRLCLNHSLEVPVEVCARVADAASQGLSYCLYRLQAGIQSIHQGFWFQLRVAVTCSFILIAAERAQQDSTLNGAALLVMPLGWRDAIFNSREFWEKYCTDGRDGMQNFGKLVDWALNNFTTETTPPATV